MTKTTTSNHTSITSPGNSFNRRISADSDVFARNDIDALGMALDEHDHTSGKGLSIATSALASNAVTQIGFASGSTSTPTIGANNTYADLADMSVTLTTNGGDLLCFFVGSFAEATTTGDGVITAFSLDGAAEVGSILSVVAIANQTVVAPTIWRFTGVSSASHTVKVRWQVTANFANWSGHTTRRQLLVVEVKR